MRFPLWLVAFVLTTLVAEASAADFVWLEGEQAKTDAEVNRAGWGNAQFLSDGNWLHCSIDAGKVEQQVPGEGILPKYEFSASKSASHQVWGRIGMEFVRSPFDWRIDDGPWQRVEPEKLTTDLMEIANWCEVAWLQLGEQPLKAGPHTLQFRLPKIKNDKGEWQRILFACDAICLSADRFRK